MVLAVTKMDLVDFDQARFDEITADYRAFAEQVGITDWIAIPVSGLSGDNVAARGGAMGWYTGPTLLDHLETVTIDSAAAEAKPFRMPVQWVSRPDQHFRGFAGQVASGAIAPGDEVRILPSGRMAATAGSSAISFSTARSIASCAGLSSGSSLRTSRLAIRSETLL